MSQLNSHLQEVCNRSALWEGMFLRKFAIQHDEVKELATANWKHVLLKVRLYSATEIVWCSPSWQREHIERNWLDGNGQELELEVPRVVLPPAPIPNTHPSPQGHQQAIVCLDVNQSTVVSGRSLDHPRVCCNTNASRQHRQYGACVGRGQRQVPAHPCWTQLSRALSPGVFVISLRP